MIGTCRLAGCSAHIFVNIFDWLHIHTHSYMIPIFNTLRKTQTLVLLSNFFMSQLPGAGRPRDCASRIGSAYYVVSRRCLDWSGTLACVLVTRYIGQHWDMGNGHGCRLWASDTKKGVCYFDGVARAAHEVRDIACIGDEDEMKVYSMSSSMVHGKVMVQN